MELNFRSHHKKISKKIVLGYFGLFFIMSACTNISQFKGLSTTNNPSSLLTTGSTVGYTHVLTNFSYAAATTSTAGVPDVALSLSTNVSLPGYQPLTNYCTTGTTGTNLCECELDWNEINTVGGVNTTIPRTKKIPLTTVQAGLATCTVPESFWDEIPNATVITMNIIPMVGNVSGLNCQSLNYKKGTSISVTGDFQDNTLTPFSNIFRYACFSKTQKTIQMTSQTVQGTSSTGGQAVTESLASAFCNGSSTSGGCSTPRSGYSAQSYYRNLYIRTSLVGSINSTNADYDCVRVVEPVTYSSGQAIPSAQQGKYWPLDSSFALAVTPTSDWSVPVSSPSMLNKANDPNTPTAGEACTGEDTTKRLGERNIFVKCLGYAKLPNPNGTCGSITDSNGRVRPLTRLRRFRMIYPPQFQASGNTLAQGTEADQIYVADRLVMNMAGQLTGNMIYGPKPCNFSWFDQKGVTNRSGVAALPAEDFQTGIPADTSHTGGPLVPLPSYVSTINYKWTDYPLSYTGTAASGSTSVTSSSSAGITVGMSISGTGIPVNTTITGIVGAVLTISNPTTAALAGTLITIVNTWSVNPDGIIFPNADYNTINGLPSLSCSAALPYTEFNGGVASSVRLLTTNYHRSDSVSVGSRSINLQEVHVRPIDPWMPNYVEDTSFLACAPLADPYLDPPLHFYKQDNDTYGWCAEAYPTQNPYWTALNSRQINPGVGSAAVVNWSAGAGSERVKGFTSHVTTPLALTVPATTMDQYNSGCTAGAGVNEAKVCALSPLPSWSTANQCKTFLLGFLHNNTCDRTMVYDANQAFLGFPLLADDASIETALSTDLSHDKTYSCQYSVNADPTKVNTKTPISACCGMVSGYPLLNPLTSGASGTKGHLEPYTPSTTPTIRFCGNPVE